MSTKRTFTNAKFKGEYEEITFEFDLDMNLSPDELDSAISFWIPTTDDYSCESLCDFICELNSEYLAYSKKDKKYLKWAKHQDVTLA